MPFIVWLVFYFLVGLAYTNARGWVGGDPVLNVVNALLWPFYLVVDLFRR